MTRLSAAPDKLQTAIRSGTATGLKRLGLLRILASAGIAAGGVGIFLFFYVQLYKEPPQQIPTALANPPSVVLLKGEACVKMNNFALVAEGEARDYYGYASLQ